MTVGKAFCDHRFHPMQCDIHEQRREHTSLSYPRFVGEVVVAIPRHQSEPSFDALPESGKGMQLIQDHSLVDMIERFFNIGVEHKAGMTFNYHQNGCYRIMCAPTGTKAVTMRFKSHLPFRF